MTVLVLPAEFYLTYQQFTARDMSGRLPGLHAPWDLEARIDVLFGANGNL
jgi:hypothetical protein